MDGSAKKYRGFVSYSQKDKAFARRLHAALESYLVPRGVSSPLLNQKTRRLGRFFRDDDEMGAASDLGEALRGAIRDSDALIVLCSPNAAKSPWVNKEIIHFKLTGRSDRIFGVIIDGEPNATDSGDPARRALECFPPALRFDVTPDGAVSDRPDEPLAIDVRKESFGKARARLAAGLLNVGFDDLWRRNQRRTRQRYMFGAGMGATAAAASAVGYVMVSSALTTSAAEVTAARGETETERANRLAAERSLTDAQAKALEANALLEKAGEDRAAAEADLDAARIATAQAKLERLGDKALAAVETFGELSAQERPLDPDYEGMPPSTGPGARVETPEELEARNQRNEDRAALLAENTGKLIDEAKWRATTLVYANVLAGGDAGSPLLDRLGFIRTSVVDDAADAEQVVGDPTLETIAFLGYSGSAIVNTRTLQRSPLFGNHYSASPDGRHIAVETPEEDRPRLSAPVYPEGYEDRLEAAADRVNLPEIDSLLDLDVKRAAEEYHRVDPMLDVAVLTRLFADIRDFRIAQERAESVDTSYVDVWSLVTGKLEWRASVDSYLGEPVFSNDARTLALVGEGVMTLWDVATRRKIDTVQFDEFADDRSEAPEVVVVAGDDDERRIVISLASPTGVAFSRDNTRIHIATNGGDIVTYDLRQRSMLRPLNPGYELGFEGLMAGPNRSIVLLTTRKIGGKSDPAVVSYNVDTGAVVRIIRPWWCDTAAASSPADLPRCDLFPDIASADGRRLALQNRDTRFFDVLGNAPPVVIAEPECGSGQFCLSDTTALGPAVNLFAYVSDDDTIHLVSTIDGKEEHAISTAGGAMDALTFSSDGARLAGVRSGPGGEDEIWTWDVASGQLLSRTGPISDWAYAGLFQLQGKGRRVLLEAGYEDPAVQVWESLGPAGETPRQALARVCKVRPQGAMMLNDLDMLALPDTAPKESDLCKWPEMPLTSGIGDKSAT